MLVGCSLACVNLLCDPNVMLYLECVDCCWARVCPAVVYSHLLYVFFGEQFTFSRRFMFLDEGCMPLPLGVAATPLLRGVCVCGGGGGHIHIM